jgi:hypothetical protein
LFFVFLGCHPSPKAEDLLLSLPLPLQLQLPLPLPLQVPAVILNVVKDPEEATPQQPFGSFNPCLSPGKAAFS